MLQLHNIADNEEGWIQVVNSMIKVIPLADPLGPSVITLLLDDCPLPSKESIIKVLECTKLSCSYKLDDFSGGEYVFPVKGIGVKGAQQPD